MARIHRRTVQKRSSRRYRKTGIVFFGLEKSGTAHQTDLFDDTPPAEKSRLYAAVDALNARYGKGKVFSAAQGIGAKSCDGVSREVPCSALKGETVPDSLLATPKSPPTRRVPPRGTPSPVHESEK